MACWALIWSLIAVPASLKAAGRIRAARFTRELCGKLGDEVDQAAW
jgi:hypothetical protein